MNIKKNIKTLTLILSVLFLNTTVQATPADYSHSANPFAKKYVYEGNHVKPSNNTQNKAQTPPKSTNKQITNPSVARSNSNGKSTSGAISKYQHLQNNSASLNGCWDKAGQAYNLDPWLLFAVAKVESSFKSDAINKNKDKRRSTDVGMMQINTFWFPTLAKLGITEEHLYDPCTSVFVGAWIMAQNIQRFGYNQDGIGAYNSPHNVTIRRNYARKVYTAYYELLKDFGVEVKK